MSPQPTQQPICPPTPQAASTRFLQRRTISTIMFSAALFASAATFLAPRLAAQDLGEIARQERAKKERAEKESKSAPPATHVYTNDDVKRAEILTPEDKSRYSAARQPDATKPAQSTAQATPPSPTLPAPQAATAAAAPKVSNSDATNAKTVPAGDVVAPANESSVPAPQSIATTIPSAAAIPASTVIPPPQRELAANAVPPVVVAEPTVPLDQMPLGDVARYYRAKKLQDEAAAAKSSPARGAYPLPVATPLATMKLPAAAPASTSRVSRSDRMTITPVTPPAHAPPSYVPRAIPSARYVPRRSDLTHPPNGHVPRRSYVSLRSDRSDSIRVAAGDTLWSLARRYLGRGARWQELIALNPSIQNPRRLRVGTQLVLHTQT